MIAAFGHTNLNCWKLCADSTSTLLEVNWSFWASSVVHVKWLNTSGNPLPPHLSDVRLEASVSDHLCNFPTIRHSHPLYSVIGQLCWGEKKVWTSLILQLFLWLFKQPTVKKRAFTVQHVPVGLTSTEFPVPAAKIYVAAFRFESR